MIKKRVLQAFYCFFKTLVKIGFALFYPKTIILNKENLSTKGPLILAANHPNGMMDPLNIALNSNRMVHFLAKSQLFTSTFTNWFFSTFYCIPVGRPDFSKDKPIDNNKSFEKCYQHFDEKGCLFVAPEGTSCDIRRILPLKTGAARIALQAEAEKGFKVGIQVVVSGITYVNQGSFWSTQYITTSSPFEIADFKELYAIDPFQAVQELTERIRNKLIEMTINLDKDEQLPFFESVIRYFNTNIEKNPKLFYEKGIELAQNLNRIDSTLLLENLAYKYLKNIETKYRISSTLVHILTQSQSLLQICLNSFLCLLSIPIFLIGFLVHFVPNFIPWAVEKLAKQDKIYVATTKFAIGFNCYLIYYPIVFYKIFQYTPNFIIGIIISAVFISVGIVIFPLLSNYNAIRARIISLFLNENVKMEIKTQILTLKDLIYR